MPTWYNRIAGQSLERLAALSDGIFAVAMTLLVLDIHAPVAKYIHTDYDLWLALGSLAPRFLVYLMSIMTLGIFWTGQQTQLNHLSQSDHHLSWIHIAFLGLVSVMPFSTSLLAEFIAFRAARRRSSFSVCSASFRSLSSTVRRPTRFSSSSFECRNTCSASLR
jgi:uncharacterized membrane protein